MSFEATRSPDVSLVHFTLLNNNPGMGDTLAGVERVMDTQKQILNGRGVNVRTVVGATDAPDPSSQSIHVIPSIRSNSEWGWKNGEHTIDQQQVSAIRRDLDQVLNGDGVVIHNSTNASKHNPAFGVAAAQRVTEDPNAVMWVHDMRGANAQQMRKLLPDRNGARLVCVSDSRRKRVEQFLFDMKSEIGGNNLPNYELMVVPNPIDIQFFTENPPSPKDLAEMAPNFEAFTRQWGLLQSPERTEQLMFDADVTRLLVPARIVRNKGIEKALEVADKYSQITGEKTALIVTGPPDLRKADGQEYWHNDLLPKLTTIRPQGDFDVVLLGGVNWDYMPHITRESKAVLAPFDNEGFCMPLIESALQRTPIIINNDPAMIETTDGHAMIVEPGDWTENPAQVARQIGRYLVGSKSTMDVQQLNSKAWNQLHPDAVANQIMKAMNA